MRKNQNAQKGSMTIEAVFVMIIILAIIFLLLYFCFYCMDGVKIRTEFLYQIMNAQEEAERNGEKNVEIEKVVKNNFSQGIVVKKIQSINSKEGIRTLTYEMNLKAISVYPIIRSVFGTGDNRMKVKVCFNRSDPCEIVRMYQAFMVKEEGKVGE